MISACMLAALTACASAQNGRPSPRSSKIGVYTEAQAARGEETFAGICQSCHTKTEYTRATFSSKWGGRPLWELYFNISTMMPQNDPGSLTPQEYAQVLAFILKQNGMPAGREELPADSVVLKTILFDTVSAQPGHTRNRLN
jgi:mono/diheme cytochrome c family protein